MSKFKVPHDSYGDHHPLEGSPILTDPYELKAATLKYVSHELNRACVHVCWEDVLTKKQYRSDVYLLKDILAGEMYEAKVVFERGLYITGNFGFEQRGQHVLLTVISPAGETINRDVLMDHVKAVFEGVLAGRYNLRQLKTEAREFIRRAGNHI